MFKSRKTRMVVLPTVAATTVLGLGLQFWDRTPAFVAEGRVEISQVEPTSAAIAAPVPIVQSKEPVVAQSVLPTGAPEQVSTVSLTVPTDLNAARTEAPTTGQSEALAAPELACDVTVQADALGQGLTMVTVDAPCLRDARFVLHHDGLMFTEITNAQGQWSDIVPAMTASASFIAAFETGDGGMGQTYVDGLRGLSRFAVQWTGDVGLGLHARVNGAAYGSDGHLHRGGPAQTAEATLMTLGNSDLPMARQVEIISYISGSDVVLSIEAEVTQSTCGGDLAATALMARADDAPATQAMSFAMPECTSLGEYLVLKNTFEDPTLAAVK